MTLYELLIKIAGKGGVNEDELAAVRDAASKIEVDPAVGERIFSNILSKLQAENHDDIAKKLRTFVYTRFEESMNRVGDKLRQLGFSEDEVHKFTKHGRVEDRFESLGDLLMLIADRTKNSATKAKDNEIKNIEGKYSEEINEYLAKLKSYESKVSEMQARLTDTQQRAFIERVAASINFNPSIPAAAREMFPDLFLKEMRRRGYKINVDEYGDLHIKTAEGFDVVGEDGKSILKPQDLIKKYAAEAEFVAVSPNPVAQKQPQVLQNTQNAQNGNVMPELDFSFIKRFVQ